MQVSAQYASGREPAPHDRDPLTGVGTSITPNVTAAQADAAAPHDIRAVTVASSKHGAPYSYAPGPERFDCSGLTLYAFRYTGQGCLVPVIAEASATGALPDLAGIGEPASALPLSRSPSRPCP